MRQKRRYKIIWAVLRAMVAPFIRRKLNYTAEQAPGYEAPVLVLSNHTTNYDPILVGMSFKKQMFFVASEHVFRFGFWSKLLVFAFGPIARVKGRTDAQAGMEILRVLRRGGNVCIFAEGNRSMDGVTGPILPATAKLAKGGADLVTYRLEGGYFTNPRWGTGLRKGRMRGAVVAHYTAAQLKKLSVDEVGEIIRRDLWEDAYERQRSEPVAYRGENIAEALETALYLCPKCGRLGGQKSAGDRFWCDCGLSLRYTETDWCAWQRSRLPEVIEQAGDCELCGDEGQQLYEIELLRGTELAGEGRLYLTKSELCLGNRRFPLGELADLAVVGPMTLTFSLLDGRQFEIRSPVPRSGFKYMELYRELKKRKGDT